MTTTTTMMIYQCRTYLKSHIFGFVRMQNHFAYGTRERERVSSSLTSLLSVHQNSAYMQTPKILIPMTKSNFIPIQFTPSVLIFFYSLPLCRFQPWFFGTDVEHKKKMSLAFCSTIVIYCDSCVRGWMGVFL